MAAFTLLFTLAAIGVAETAYLIKQRRAKKAPVCPMGKEESCQIVLESKYNKIFGIHNDILGLAFYLVVSFITAFLVIGTPPLRFWDLVAKIMISGGALFSFYLTYLQWRVLKTWCFWCLMSTATTLLMFITTLLL